MLSFAADFWPLFWAIVGSAALVTVVLALLVATFSPVWFQRRRRHQPFHAQVAQVEGPDGQHYRAAA